MQRELASPVYTTVGPLMPPMLQSESDKLHSALFATTKFSFGSDLPISSAACVWTESIVSKSIAGSWFACCDTLKVLGKISWKQYLVFAKNPLPPPAFRFKSPLHWEDAWWSMRPLAQSTIDGLLPSPVLAEYHDAPAMNVWALPSTT